MKKKTQQRLKSSREITFLIPAKSQDKRFKPKIKIMTQFLSVKEAKVIWKKVNKFIELSQ